MFIMVWNVFKFCMGFKVVGFIMVLVVLGVVGVFYYVVVIINYGLEFVRGGFDVFMVFFVFFFFYVLLVMLLWCYFLVVFIDFGGVLLLW